MINECKITPLPVIPDKNGFWFHQEIEQALSKYGDYLTHKEFLNALKELNLECKFVGNDVFSDDDTSTRIRQLMDKGWFIGSVFNAGHGQEYILFRNRKTASMSG
ncbi:TPA: hypothetical protein IGZ65_005272 [Escherichia coli]|nr:hypothetical protein [Escherichia coli]